VLFFARAQGRKETRPDMKVKLKSFLSGKWGAGSRRLSAQHFLTLKIDFNFPFTCNVWCGVSCLSARAKERQERDKKPAATDEGHVTGSDRKCVSGEAAGLRPCLSDTDTNFLSNATGNEGPSCRSGTRFFVSLSLSFVGRVARARREPDTQPNFHERYK
jgi:hypothetical protein